MKFYIGIVSFLFTSFFGIAQNNRNVFVLNQLPLPYNCNCIDTFNLNQKSTIMYLNTNQLSLRNTVNLTLYDEFEYPIDSMNLIVGRKFIYLFEEGRRFKLFSFKKNKLNKRYNPHVKNKIIGYEIFLRKLYLDSKLGEIFEYDILKFNGLTVDPYVYTVKLSVKYGILSFGYYNGNVRFLCKLKLIEKVTW